MHQLCLPFVLKIEKYPLPQVLAKLNAERKVVQTWFSCFECTRRIIVDEQK